MTPACKWRLLRFRCSRTSSTLRSGSRRPPFSTRPDLNCAGASPLLSTARARRWPDRRRGCAFRARRSVIRPAPA
ncbi:hypothetical protein EN828_21155 [Mesorhizobium sp. M2D.F.Ca.ET.185.01.1.1]|nr:hypothetical protein EN783_15890 [Mesorhizobium sp. M2D.F.Ca.ET.140.01.1.1]TGP16651.1 hypothetical protein EN876_16030 [Mesorhizobium sp. M2D.F.Ca.ET.233.01.1.1]TGP31801.1 hypothetical protein EN875_020545 [Mesorhizobium sp. M2D.F.Ca.ET.232.01.1.1]TGP51185.1 hypothetical protein EN873_21205 [bacterium M00.F.Ca.ET.230.01.1.1]TGP57670.1 hypothetical protein EN869_021260 [Mesorhizobium sp. M2D.F.Ca.ET.226.01.1.1]TGP66408.1 hypothetical protein EN868_21570 [Mesorhizobium sp. M2D.F.Ca.ET.225.01.